MSAAFDPSASYVPAGLRKAVAEAVAVGWTAKKNRGRGGWNMTSPKRTQTFYVPITCKDADTLAKELRSRMSKAYFAEPSAFKPKPDPGEAAYLQELADMAIMKGATIIPGETPYIRCPICDEEYEGWEAFALHQPDCDAAKKRADVEKERERVLDMRTAGKTYTEIADAVNLPRREVADIIDHFIEGASQDVTESPEPVHSGTISTKEETPVASTSSTPMPKPGPGKSSPEVDAKTGRRRGYRWTQVSGRGNPLHEIIYTAVRMNRRLRDETDSQWTRRLADFIESEGLLGKLPDATPEGQATYMLNQIKDVLYPGGLPVEENPEEIEQYQQEIAAKNEEIEGLKKEVSTLKEFFGTMNSLAQEMNTKEVKREE